ncbi:hypothetical protein BC936DRAFT_137554 [Jimgerdemannia flammicorona]|uniref:Uncharacterized protein n=1 Tax=Jimgerdemannia flammicorona TaxID=994334 RepID=A0A433CX28_9FUNG|nr:hypothetical protein BC936DRAFT_137554 [Jimgerdemannia flammicorona]
MWNAEHGREVQDHACPRLQSYRRSGEAWKNGLFNADCAHHHQGPKWTTSLTMKVNEDEECNDRKNNCTLFASWDQPTLNVGCLGVKSPPWRDRGDGNGMVVQNLT